MRARTGWLVIAVAAACAAWLGSAELAGPARAYVVVLVALLPALMMLQARIPIESVAHQRVEPVYVSSMLMIWVLGIAAWLVARASHFDRATLGLRAAPVIEFVAWTGAVTLAALGIMALGRVLGWRESGLVGWLLPSNARERVLFLLLSISAGVGEELAYRSFLVPALTASSGSVVLAVVVSSAAFGAMHGYQNVAGVLRATVLGVLLALPLVFTGSIYPSMTAHALIDVVAGILLADWLVPGRDRRGPRSGRQD